jgi:hypothetical protein
MYIGEKEAGVIPSNLIVADGDVFVTYVETDKAPLALICLTLGNRRSDLSLNSIDATLAVIPYTNYWFIV